MKQSLRLLWILGLFTLYLLLFIILVEVEKTSERASIQSFGDAAWYALVTLTTVGYGDLYPVTTTGRIIGAVFLLSSIGVLGVLVGTIASGIRTFQQHRLLGYYGTSMRNHIIILGWDSFAKTVLDCLLSAGRRVAIITNNKEDIEAIHHDFASQQVFALYTTGYDMVQHFSKANIANAALVYVNLPSDTDTLIAVLNIRREFPSTEFLVVLKEARLKDTFYSAGVRYVLSTNEIAAKMVASYIFEPDVANFNNDLLSHALNSNDYDVQEYKVLDGNPFAGLRYGEVFTTIHQQYKCLVIGLVKVRDGQRILLKLPDDAIPVEAGDYLIFILNHDQAERISAVFHTDEGV
jgi:voltage-gated potassium channel